jgi:hypothetical protein
MASDLLFPDASRIKDERKPSVREALERFDRCFTKPELRRYWGCRMAEINRLIADGTLSAIRVGRGVKILPDSIRAAERGPLAVRRRVVRRREKIDPRVLEMLK